MNTIMKKAILARKTPMCTRPSRSDPAGRFRASMKGSVQPPRKSVTIMAAEAIMLAYSPRKKRANFIELYSVW